MYIETYVLSCYLTLKNEDKITKKRNISVTNIKKEIIIMKLSKSMKKGFTLVELIVVIAIIAILAAVSVAGYFGFIEQSKQSVADQEAAQVKTTIVAATAGQGYTGKFTTSAGYKGVYGTGAITISGASSVTDVIATALFAEIYTVSEDPTASSLSAKIETTHVANSGKICILVSGLTSATTVSVTGFTYYAANNKSSTVKF
jgi:prepilin-type N-terminal cleavage/methylation domain-containing protein